MVYTDSAGKPDADNYFQEDDFTVRAKAVFTGYNSRYDTLLYTSQGQPLMIHPVNPPSLNDIWCFGDLEFYAYRNGTWVQENDSPTLSLLRKDVESAKAAGSQVIFSYGRQSGYSEDMYGYTLQVVGAADSRHEYDYDGLAMKVHDQERRYER